MNLPCLKRVLMPAAALCAACFFANAQKVEVLAGSDIVSSYVWRGQNLGGVSVQPTASAAVSGFSLAAWGSAGFDGNDVKELDFTLGYAAGGFSIAVTDYWFDTSDNYFDYATATTAHVFEATAGYGFGKAAVSINTCFAGNDYIAGNGKRAFSAYVEISAPFKLGGTDLKAEAGFTPWKGLYADRFGVVNAGIKVSKEIRVTDSFSIPAFTKISFNPYRKKCFLTFGLTL